MANRGRRRGPPNYRRRREPAPVADTLGTTELEFQDKKLVMEMKSNAQGKFVKVLEYAISEEMRGRIILSIESCAEFRTLLNEFVAEYERLPAAEEVTDSDRLKTDSFSEGRRRYYVDLRQNQRGRFLKVTMLGGNKTFIAVPGDGLIRFRDAFAQLLDKYSSVDSDPAPQPHSSLPASQSVSADSKTFHFDVEKNSRGVFMKMTEMLASGYRVSHVNIPHSSWTKIGDMFHSFAKELPYQEESSASGSDDN